MRAIDCTCGSHIEAESDEALFSKVKVHTKEAHPDWNATDERVRDELKQHTYDTEAKK